MACPCHLGLFLNVGILLMGDVAGNGKAAGPKPVPLSGFIPTFQRPRYVEIRAVMEQIPDIQKESLDQFDCKLLNPSLQKAADKRRKDQFKRLIAGCIGVGPWSILPSSETRCASKSETRCSPDH